MDSQLGDIGGQLGLFVGGSFLTMFEFGEYIYDKCFQQTKRKKRAITRRVHTIREKRRTSSIAKSSIHGNLSGNIPSLNRSNELKSPSTMRVNGL